MCTLSWSVAGRETLVFFNRDEKKSRPAALPPRLFHRRGVRFLAPVDGLAGGSWISVNEHGLCLAILNYYDADLPVVQPALPVSRGLLLMALAPCPDTETVASRLAVDSMASRRPFHLFALRRGGIPQLFTWNGFRLETRTLSDEDRPVSSSSFDTGRVLDARRRAFRAHAVSGGGPSTREQLESFHLSRDNENDARSVFMCRPDAQTVSLTRVFIGTERVRMEYMPREGGGRILEMPAVSGGVLYGGSTGRRTK